MRNIMVPLLVLFTLWACAYSQAPNAPNPASDNRALAEAGHRVAELKCARCHAIERSGESRDQNAPPFREVSQSIAIMSSETTLREGIRIGHMDMPPVRLTQAEIEALTAYLHSLQS